MKRTAVILLLCAAVMAAPAQAGGTGNARAAGPHIAVATAQVQIIRMEQIRFAGPLFAKGANVAATGSKTLSHRRVAADGRILIEFN